MKNSAFYVVAICAIGALLWLTYGSRGPKQQVDGPVSAADAPQPIGPYSQAVKRGNALFVSGQIALDPETGAMDTGSIQAETRRVMQNIQAILLASHMDMNDIAKTTIYLTDMDNFKAVNEIYGSFFGKGPFPARETVEVQALPKGAHIEISVTAIH